MPIIFPGVVTVPSPFLMIGSSETLNRISGIFIFYYLRMIRGASLSVWSWQDVSSSKSEVTVWRIAELGVGFCFQVVVWDWQTGNEPQGNVFNVPDELSSFVTSSGQRPKDKVTYTSDKNEKCMVGLGVPKERDEDMCRAKLLHIQRSKSKSSQQEREGRPCWNLGTPRLMLTLARFWLLPPWPVPVRKK